MAIDFDEMTKGNCNTGQAPMVKWMSWGVNPTASTVKKTS